MSKKGSKCVNINKDLKAKAQSNGLLILTLQIEPKFSSENVKSFCRVFQGEGAAAATCGR